MDHDRHFIIGIGITSYRWSTRVVALVSSSNHEAIQYFTPGHGGPLRKSERI